MIRSALTLALFSLFIPSTGFSATISLQPSGKKIENVEIAKSAVTNVEGRSAAMDLVGAGIRKKTLFNVKVYVAQVFVDQLDKFTRKEDRALDSTDQMNTVAVHLTFLRNVGAKDVMNAYLDSLDANDVDTDSQEIQDLLNAVKQGGDAPDGSTMILIGERLPNGGEAITYESPVGTITTIHGKTGFVHAMLSIWLGETTDSHLANLKQEIIQGNL